MQIAKIVGQKVGSFSKFYKILTFADKILIILLLGISVSGFFWIGSFVQKASYIEVKVNNRLVGQFKLKKDNLVGVRGKLGLTLIEIKDGDARIVESPCPNKLCMQPRSGDLVVCVPNGVVIRFVNKTEEDSEFDSISR